jgi:hypothetical protein
MCKCITDLQEKIVKEQPIEGLKVIKAKATNVAFMFDVSAYRFTGELSLEVEGRKRPVKRGLLFSFCPCCGQPYDTKNSFTSRIIG